MWSISDMLKRRIAEFIIFYKGLRPAARALGIDPSYLARLRDGDKDNPSENLLKKLGLIRTVYVTYTPRKREKGE